jgi:hypothetical protein
MNNITKETKNVTENQLTTKENGSSVKKNRAERGIKRRERTPLYEQRRIMKVAQDPNYKYRLVNDSGDNLAAFVEGGWEILDRNGNEMEVHSRLQDSSWRQSAASQPVGGGTIGYMMRIPLEWWKEDQVVKQNRITELENSIIQKREIGKETGIQEKNFYGDISISHTKSK